MTVKECKAILTDMLKGGWVTFKDSSDIEYYLKEIKETSTKDEMMNLISDIQDSILFNNNEMLNDLYDEMNV